MQQRQLRLGDILDDYCPRERRVTNHAVVAMVGEDVKQTRCTTCDAEHEYKHARIPRQRKKGETPAALYAQVASGAPKRVAHETPATTGSDVAAAASDAAIGEPTETVEDIPVAAAPARESDVETDHVDTDHDEADVDEPNGNEDRQDEGPIHRRLIRASLPRPEGQQPPARPIPEFTIRQPGGRNNRFRPRHPRGSGGGQGQQFFGNRSNGNNSMRGPRPNSGRPGGGMMNRRGHGGGGGRKRSK